MAMAMQMAVFTAVKSEHMKLRLKICGNKIAQIWKLTEIPTFNNARTSNYSDINTTTIY